MNSIWDHITLRIRDGENLFWFSCKAMAHQWDLLDAKKLALLLSIINGLFFRRDNWIYPFSAADLLAITCFTSPYFYATALAQMQRSQSSLSITSLCAYPSGLIRSQLTILGRWSAVDQMYFFCGTSTCQLNQTFLFRLGPYEFILWHWYNSFNCNTWSASPIFLNIPII